MPYYDYHCVNCTETFEQFRKISERDEPTVCPVCGEGHLLNRNVGSPLVAYSVTVPGSYGRNVPDGFKEVLKRIHSRAPGSRLNELSSHM